MKWNRFTIKTKTEAEDVIISALADVGVEGVEIQDKQPLTETDKEQMFVDIMPEGPADDGIAYLNFYLEGPSGTSSHKNGWTPTVNTPGPEAVPCQP